MKTLNVYLKIVALSLVLFNPAMAQRSVSRWSNYDAITTYRLGMQGVNLGELNQALQQAGYGNLSSQVPVISVTSQFSRANKPLAFQSEFGLSFGSGQRVTNGAYKATSGFYYFKIGGTYSLIHSEKFQLGPQLSIITIPFHLGVEPVSSTAPSLNTILTNPGSTQKATLRTSSGGIDAGLTAHLRIPYSQRQLDCSTMERSFVIGLDAGYRFTGRSPLDASHEISANNPAIQLSGWYAGLRLGFGTRVRSTTPVTY
ncbi:hypothetical protein [Spirosoma pollinicola]|uniref:Outer membrane protein beta-barrel domain-containing protein n=1 Tax=Spirosoma pollinicola TaxID=2057025 RepID=A0A2K8Z4L6_9BACT|nr:hypothetical protein [Spirosoma pollinicola]AUD04836.1 hypothetical protein CWM47_25140 [Spirosoma pollinicola]